MKIKALILALVAQILTTYGQEISPKLSVEERMIGENPMQRYFLIEHKKPMQSKSAKGLIVILPGGPGSEEFLPFCADVLTLHGIPTNFTVAQLIAPKWTEEEARVVWPSRSFPDTRAEFSSEDFVKAVIDDVGTIRMIDERHIFVFGWSSSGHVLYSALASEPKVKGAIIAMSRYLPSRFARLDQMHGKSLFLYHSPEDRICPFAESENVEKELKRLGIRAKLVPYKGGHGWLPNTFCCDRIKEGIEWLKHNGSEQSAALNADKPSE